MKPRHLALFTLTPLFYLLITLATGFVITGEANGVLEYGWPLPWKTVELIPTCNMCPLPTTYNWMFFALDAMFYSAVGFGIVSLSLRIARRKKNDGSTSD